tara:strand:- start:187 stop:786 length:600 start_codon:yes stop_codon:yes gene_type:complete
MNWFKSASFIALTFLILLNLITLNNPIVYLLLLLCLVRLLFKYLYYQKNYQITSAEFQSGFVYSPISGIVDSVVFDNDRIKIMLKQHWYEATSICFPISGEVTKIEYNKKTAADYFSYTEVSKLFIGNQKFNVFMRLISPIIAESKSVLRKGDIGNTGAIFSQMPFCGKLEMTLPSYFKLIVRNGEKVIIGKTPMASWE